MIGIAYSDGFSICIGQVLKLRMINTKYLTLFILCNRR